MEPIAAVAAFLFQSHPDRWDLRRFLKPGVTGEWSANQYRSQMHPGQLVLLWEAKGSKKEEVRGLYGWGITTSEVKKGLHGGPVIQVKYIERWIHPHDADQEIPEIDNIAPIEAPVVLSLPSWTEHRLTSMAIGTNFIVTSNQLEELTEKVIKPRIPDSDFPRAVKTANSQVPLEPNQYKLQNIITASGLPQHTSMRNIPTNFIRRVGLPGIADQLQRLPWLQTPKYEVAYFVEAPRLLSDKWIEEKENDKFEFRSIAEDIAKAIVHPNQLTAAIYGKWGSGKTTLMRFIKNELDKEFNWAVSWFDLWEHQHEACILASLLDNLAKTIGKSRIADDIKGLALSALACTKLSTPAFSVSGSEFLKTMKDYRKTSKPARDKLASCVDTWSKKRTKQYMSGRIAIFVDNIERCSPDIIGRFLQEVNVLFDFPGVTFILAAEREQLQDAISKLYETSGKAFLEKFIQAEFTVPRIEDELLIPWMMEQYSALNEEEAKLITASVESNPRAIKRTLNNLSINRITVSKEFRNEMDLLLASTLLFDRSPDIWREITEKKRPERAKKSKGIRFDRNVLGLRQIPEGADDIDAMILNSEGGHLMRGLSDDDMHQFALLTRDTAFGTRAWESLAEKTEQKTRIAEQKKFKNPNDINAILDLADVYIANDKLREANELYNEALEKGLAEDVKACTHVRLARVLSNMNKEKDALEHAEKAAALGIWDEPEDAITIASEFFESDKLDKASDVCDSALKKWPDNLDILNLQASILYSNEKLQEALKIYDRILGIDPSYALAYINRGIILYSMHHWEEAVASYEKALEYWPDDFDTILLLGDALYYMGRYDEQLEKYEQALKIKPNDSYALYSKAYLLSRKGKLDDAYKTLEKALSSGFSDFEHVESDEDLKPMRDDPEYGPKLKNIIDDYRQRAQLK